VNISILTYGSRGDVQPFIALAAGLQAAGHAVRLAAPQRFADLAALHGVAFASLAGDPEEISLGLNNAGRNPILTVRAISDYVFSIAGAVLQTVQSACEDADLIIHSFLFTTGGHSLARARSIPDVSVQTFPVFAPTRAFPNVAAANLPPGALSYFSHWLATQVFWHGGNLGYSQLRRNAAEIFDLKLHWPFKDPGPGMTPLLFAYSPRVVPRPDDWRASHVHITGYLFLDAAAIYHPPPELIRFLDAGKPPVCVTFGSMVNRRAEDIARTVRAALQRMQQRGIILTGWSGQESVEPADDLFYIDSAPHNWLLPRCSIVIHHGGAGTTGAGLRAGIPNIIIPHAADQPFWGKRVAAIGAGPQPISVEKLSEETLAAALHLANSDSLRSLSAAIGRQIRSEDGVAAAVRVIEKHAAAYHRT
jgi:sterol 3beta-glucosyltransferase